jgi:hypothetical protein
MIITRDSTSGAQENKTREEGKTCDSCVPFVPRSSACVCVSWGQKRQTVQDVFHFYPMEMGI